MVRIAGLSVAAVLIILALWCLPNAGDAQAASSADYATEVVYRAWNGRCGEGFPWWCSNRRSYTDVRSYRRDSNGRVISWAVDYCWVDSKPGAWKQWCVYAEANTRDVLRLLWPSDPNSPNRGKVLNSHS